MKITSIEIQPSNSTDTIELSFRDPKNLLPYTIQTITGLDATTLDSRVIVMKMGLNPEFRNYGDLRDTLYKAISSSRTGLVQLLFKNGTAAIASIIGYISKLEAPQFDKNPTVTVTITCDDPFLRALARVFMTVAGVDLTNLNVLDDSSTAPHGFIFTVAVLSAIPDITIFSPSDPSWSLEVIPIGGFLAGDEIYFSSEPSNKYIYMVRAGVTIQLADVIAPNSTWPLLYPGNNVLAFSNGINLRLDSLSYYPTFWGI